MIDLVNIKDSVTNKVSTDETGDENMERSRRRGWGFFDDMVGRASGLTGDHIHDMRYSNNGRRGFFV